MPGTWKDLTLPLLAVLMLLTSACDANDPLIDTPEPQRLQIQGALDVAFEEDTAHIVGHASAADLNLGRQQSMHFFAQEITQGERRRVDVVLQLLIPAEMRVLRPGEYHFEGTDLNARVKYDVIQMDSTEARAYYLFGGTSLTLRIDQADLHGIRGRFMLEGELGEAQRFENGQWMAVQFPSGGAIQVASRFHITDISVR